MNNSTLSCELLVAGGGPAGVATALAAARQGIDVILIQNRPVLGGNASSEVRMHIVGANGGQQGIPLVAEARESGLIEEVRLEQCVQNPQRSPSMLDLTLFDLCKREPTLRLLLNTTLVGATVEDQKIIRVQAERQAPRMLSISRPGSLWMPPATGAWGWKRVRDSGMDARQSPNTRNPWPWKRRTDGPWDPRCSIRHGNMTAPCPLRPLPGLGKSGRRTLSFDPMANRDWI